jgi:hypothetical protein
MTLGSFLNGGSPFQDSEAGRGSASRNVATDQVSSAPLGARIAVNPTAQLLLSEQRGSTPDQIEPGATGGSTVQLKARMAYQPALACWGLVVT